MADNHIRIEKLPYCKLVKIWLLDRYGREKAIKIWRKTRKQYNEYLSDLPDYGGKKNNHAWIDEVFDCMFGTASGK